MTDRAQQLITDVAIRAAGLLCCASSYLAVVGLADLRIATPAAQPGAIAYALAAVAFLCGSVGTALVTLGRHIFDQIEVSERWQHRPAPQSRPEIVAADRASADAEYPAAGTDHRATPRALSSAFDLPLPWRDFRAIVHRSADLRVGSRW